MGQCAVGDTRVRACVAASVRARCFYFRDAYLCSVHSFERLANIKASLIMTS